MEVGQKLAKADVADSSQRYFNRELSWLSFNRRVLAEACNPDYPLLERLRFLSISGSNLDEFLMVRVAGLYGQVRRRIEQTSIDGLTPTQQLAAITEAVLALEAAQQAVWQDLRASLANEGITVLGKSAAAGCAPSSTNTSCRSSPRRRSTRPTPSPSSPAKASASCSRWSALRMARR